MTHNQPNPNPLHPLLLECVDLLAEFGRQWRELKAKQAFVNERITESHAEYGEMALPRDLPQGAQGSASCVD